MRTCLAERFPPLLFACPLDARFAHTASSLTTRQTKRARDVTHRPAPLLATPTRDAKARQRRAAREATAISQLDETPNQTWLLPAWQSA